MTDKSRLIIRILKFPMAKENPKIDVSHKKNEHFCSFIPEMRFKWLANERQPSDLFKGRKCFCEWWNLVVPPLQSMLFVEKIGVYPSLNVATMTVSLFFSFWSNLFLVQRLECQI